MKKFCFTVAFCFALLLSGNAQNGFVKIGTLNFDWVDENCYDNRIAFQLNKKLGFCDSTGTIKIAEQFSGRSVFINGYAKVTKDGSNYFYINTKGEPLLNKNNEQIMPIGNDGFYRTTEGKTIFYDKNLNETGELPIKQLFTGDYANGLFPVLNNNNLWGFADLSPKIIIPCVYSSTNAFKDGLAVVRKGALNENKTGVINTLGEEVVPLQYHLIFRMYNYCILEKNEQLQFFDIAQKKMVTEQVEMRWYKYLSQYNSHFKIAKNAQGELALFNQSLKQTCVIAYDDCKIVDDATGLIAVKKDNLWGLINQTGQEVIPCTYDEIGPVQNGLMKVVKKQINGYLDQTGKLVIPLQFTNSGSFYSKYITAKYKNGYIVLRPKSNAELKKETQLIAQKKLPTAEACFDLALTDASIKVNEQKTEQPTNDDFEKRNSKQQVLARQTANYLKYFLAFNESFDNWIKASTACLKAPITKTCTDYQWRHSSDVVYALVGILKNLKNMRSELETLKKVDFAYLCNNNNNSILKNIDAQIKTINLFLDAHELTLNSETKLLQSYSIEGGDFTRYAKQIKSLANYQMTKSDPQLLTIDDSGKAMKKLFESCK
ncbi:MAG: WG repeat-containing protein [Ferruginibacter sp.]